MHHSRTLWCTGHPGQQYRVVGVRGWWGTRVLGGGGTGYGYRVPVLALLVPVLALLCPIMALLALLWPYWAYYGPTGPIMALSAYLALYWSI